MSIERKPINEELLQEIAEDIDLPVKMVKEIVNSQSKFTAEVIRSGLFDTVRWPYFGTFKAKVKHATILNYMKGLTPEQRKFFGYQKKMAYEKKKAKRNKRK
tara:strand:+ start:1297 stop:1602 length:306 start_codon:yes stop_codon:yes gene_type:complete